MRMIRYRIGGDCAVCVWPDIHGRRLASASHPVISASATRRQRLSFWGRYVAQRAAVGVSHPVPSGALRPVGVSHPASCLRLAFHMPSVVGVGHPVCGLAARDHHPVRGRVSAFCLWFGVPRSASASGILSVVGIPLRRSTASHPAARPSPVARRQRPASDPPAHPPTRVPCGCAGYLPVSRCPAPAPTRTRRIPQAST